MKSRSRARSECNGEPRRLLDLVSGRGQIDQGAAADCLSAKAFERAGLQLARAQLAGTFLEIVVSRRDGPGILATLELTTGGLTKAYRAKRKYVAEYRKEKDEAEYKDQQSLDKDDLYKPVWKSTSESGARRRRVDGVEGKILISTQVQPRRQEAHRQNPARRRGNHGGLHARDLRGRRARDAGRGEAY